MTWSITLGVVGWLFGGLVLNLALSKGVSLALWGVFASCIGAAVTLLIAHLILAWNRRMVEPDE